MTLSNINQWLVPVSTAVGIISVSVGILITLREYRLKVQAETRLQNAARVERDIQLLKLFIETMSLANARGQAQVSEKAIEMLLSPEVLAKRSPNDPSIRDLLNTTAVFVLPVGEATQDAAIASIRALAYRHELLRPAALQALETLVNFKGNVAQKYLDDLRANFPPLQKPAE